MIVTYTSNDEILVTTDADERAMLARYFGPDMGRDLENYERGDTESRHPRITVTGEPEVIEITNTLKLTRD